MRHEAKLFYINCAWELLLLLMLSLIKGKILSFDFCWFLGKFIWIRYGCLDGSISTTTLGLSRLLPSPKWTWTSITRTSRTGGHILTILNQISKAIKCQANYNKQIKWFILLFLVASGEKFRRTHNVKLPDPTPSFLQKIN